MKKLLMTFSLRWIELIIALEGIGLTTTREVVSSLRISMVEVVVGLPSMRTGVVVSSGSDLIVEAEVARTVDEELSVRSST